MDQIVDQVLAEMGRVCATDKIAPHEFTILSPVVRQKKGEFHDLLDNLQEKGYRTVIVDDEIRSLDDDIPLLKTNKHTITSFISASAVGYYGDGKDAWLTENSAGTFLT